MDPKGQFIGGSIWPSGGIGGGTFAVSDKPIRPDRLSRPELFMRIAHLFGQRATCPRAQVGVVAVKDGRIVASGYNGAPSGMPHCFDVGCDMRDGHCARSVHAEANMVSWAARTGTPLEDTDIYCVYEPCETCAKLLINIGINSFSYNRAYGDHKGIELFRPQFIRIGRVNVPTP